MSIRDTFFRVTASIFGVRESAMAVPVLAGPGRGLWLRETGEASTETGISRQFASSKRTFHLAQFVKPGWTVWDCGGEAGVSTILFSKFVGQEGLVVAFEPERKNFMRTYDNATLNACNNIFFLFASIGEPAPKRSFAPPVCARQMSLDEAYQDGEIPIPQLVRLDLVSSGESALQHCRQLVSEQRPILVIDKYAADTEKGLRAFAAEYRYEIQSLDTGVALEGGKLEGSLLLQPAEKK